jgi:hypothetical protein
MERGEITLEDARQKIMTLGEAKGFEADIYAVFASMGSTGGVKEKLADFAATLRPHGFTTACVTNNVKEFGEGWRNLIPTAEIFHIALERAGVKPEEVLFLDDFEANLDAAKVLGIDGIFVTPDEEKTISDLKQALKL